MSVPVSRRQFIGRLAAIAGGGATVLGAAVWAGHGSPQELSSLYQRLTTPILPDDDPGPLGSRTLSTLTVATKHLLDHPGDLDRYRNFFRWRSEHVPGYRPLYDQFATALERSAQQEGGVGYLECDEALQRRLLAGTLEVPERSGPLRQLRAWLLNRDALLFQNHIQEEILTLFWRTDAWRLAGYPDWPGMPRGLDRYTHPPTGQSGSRSVH